MSSRRPHRQVRVDNGSGRKRRLHNHTRNGCGSMRVARLVGNAVSAAETNGPCCDLTNARAGSDKVGHTCLLKYRSSKHRAARCCHPCFGSMGSASGSNTGGVSRPTQHLQPLTVPHCDKTWRRVSMNAHDPRFGDLRVPLFDHVNAISPTGPMCCHARPHRGHQTQTSQRERQL